ncbi:MAG TPA: family 1 glycosylhydrolase [Myxococcota bacterium]
MRHALAALALAVVTAAVVTGCPNEPAPGKQGFLAVQFPSTFAWGTATAGWQVEGDTGVNGPVDSNWSRWMAMGKGKGAQQNPDGNGFFTQYDSDAQLAADLGLDSFRLSVDWSRIEPQPGVFDDDELDHVVDVLHALKAHGLKPVLTLYHWTVPTWVQNPDGSSPGGTVDLIGSEDHAVVDEFEKFVRHVIPRVKDSVDTYTVLNEPLSMVVAGYISGTAGTAFPPGNALDFKTATNFGVNLMYMHARAYDVIKELDDVDADGDGEPAFVGLTMTANDIYPENPSSQQEQLAAESMNYVYNDWFIQGLVKGDVDFDLNGTIDATDTHADPALVGRLDFIGVQYYGPVKVKELAFLDNVAPLYGLPLTDVKDYVTADEQALPHNGMGRQIDASDFTATLEHYAQWNLPLIVTENGTTVNGVPPDDQDPNTEFAPDEDQAAMYLVVHIWEMGHALQKGLDIRGYFHWTLVDNFEWVEGRRQRFGAYTVDFSDPTYPRTKTKMGQALEDIAKAGGVTEDIWNKYVLARFPSDTTKAGVGVTTSEPVIGTLGSLH